MLFHLGKSNARAVGDIVITTNVYSHVQSIFDIYSAIECYAVYHCPS